jgi:uncharacterized RDD family membrane protein YckC
MKLNMDNPEQDLLTDTETWLSQAGMGKRFANYIIDLLLFYLLIVFLGIIVALVNPNVFANMDESFSFGLFDRVVTLFIYGFYMSLMEGIFKGKTLGKLITRTRAVHEDGSPVTLKTALLRGLIRAVPFDQFSALGDPSYPWHDRWSKTYVIDEKTSRLPQA